MHKNTLQTIRKRIQSNELPDEVLALQLADIADTKALTVIASSRPAAVRTWRTCSITRSSSLRAEGTIGTPTSSGISS